MIEDVVRAGATIRSTLEVIHYDYDVAESGDHLYEVFEVATGKVLAKCDMLDDVKRKLVDLEQLHEDEPHTNYGGW